MRRSVPALAVLCIMAASATSLAGQERLHVGIWGDRSTYNEAVSSEELAGFGAAGSLRFQSGAWALEGDLSWRSVSPTAAEGESITLLETGVWARYRVWRTLSGEVGARVRTADPEFAVQDVAFVPVGLHYETPLTSLAHIWVRGSAIPYSSFNGGGESGIGIGVGFGVRLGPAGARWRGVAQYSFQRIDRTVRDTEVPIQLEGLRLGFEYGVF